MYSDLLEFSNMTLKNVNLTFNKKLLESKLNRVNLGSIKRFARQEISQSIRKENMSSMVMKKPKRRISQFSSQMDKDVKQLSLPSLTIKFKSIRAETQVEFDSDPECLKYEENIRKYDPSPYPANTPCFYEEPVKPNKEITAINFDRFVAQKRAESCLEKELAKTDYSCKYCGEFFNSGCSLGGHISKMHRGADCKNIIRIKRNIIKLKNKNIVSPTKIVLEKLNIP